MIYTIGNADVYDPLLAEATPERPLRKLGRRIDDDNYPGGTVFQTEQDARDYLTSQGTRLVNYKVYGVLADWEKDTAPSELGAFHDLLVSSVVVDLDNCES